MYVATAKVYGARSAARLPYPSPAPFAPRRPYSAPARGWSEGPRLPAADPGLRNTPLARLQMLFATCLVDGLIQKDVDWVNSPDFITVCVYAGLQGDTPQIIRQMFNDGALNLKRLSYWNCGLARESAA